MSFNERGERAPCKGEPEYVKICKKLFFIRIVFSFLFVLLLFLCLLIYMHIGTHDIIYTKYKSKMNKNKKKKIIK